MIASQKIAGNLGKCLDCILLFYKDSKLRLFRGFWVPIHLMLGAQVVTMYICYRFIEFIK